MQYIGGKEKSGGHKIAGLLRSICDELDIHKIVEPFCGGLSVTYRLCKMGIEVEASDGCIPLISMYKSILGGWDPPQEVSREEWERWKQRNPVNSEDPMAAFCGFGCSRSGSWFSAFIEDYKYTKRRVAAATAARTSLLRKLGHCGELALFKSCDYRSIEEGRIIYCDPPYVGRLEYPAIGEWDSDAFWKWAKSRVDHGSIVIVSEMEAPEDWESVVSWDIQSRISTGAEGKRRRTEHVFMHNSQICYYQMTKDRKLENGQVVDLPGSKIGIVLKYAGWNCGRWYQMLIGDEKLYWCSLGYLSK